MDNEVEQGKAAFENIERILTLSKKAVPYLKVGLLLDDEFKAMAYDDTIELFEQVVDAANTLLAALKKVIEDAERGE